MKQAHILNIGYPKCGTTWLWHELKNQPWFVSTKEKENNDLIYGVKSLSQYMLDYNQHDITANFSPVQYAMDRYMIRQLYNIESVAVSIILRNPYDLYWSLYNFQPPPEHWTFNYATKNLVEQGWVNRVDLILKRWTQIFSVRNFEIFFYEDLCADSELFFNNYCRRMKLPIPVTHSSAKINVTSYQQDIVPQLDTDLVDIINNNIDNLQCLLDRNISHWKR